MALGLSERTSLGWVAVLRIAVGALFLEAAVRKLREGFRARQLLGELDAWQSAGRTVDFYRDQVLAAVRERADLAAMAVTGGELVAGFSLVLGLGSRAGALVGFALNVNYFLASGERINILAGLVNLAVLVAAGGRALGLDGLIKNRAPRWFLG